MRSTRLAIKSSFPSQRRNFIDNAVGLATVLVGATALGTGLFFTERYRVADPNQYLVRSGPFTGPSGVSIDKKGLQYPFQKYAFINMHPHNYTFNLHAMSIEKIDFILPGVFTIGPSDNQSALLKYAKILIDGEGSYNLDDIILGILEGEVRTLSSQMTIEEIFNNRKAFKENVVKSVQEELDQIGLHIYNANIKELQDGQDSKYFQTVRQKKISEAENSAKVDVAEANKFGNIGQKERETLTRQRVIELESQTVVLENRNKKEIELSNADLKTIESEAYRIREVAKIEAENLALIKKAEMEKQLETKRIETEIERARASNFSQTQVQYEITIKEAQAHADAMKIKADADLYAKMKEAEGVYALYEAEANGVEKVKGVFGDNSSTIQLVFANKGIYGELAKRGAQAVQGMRPNISIWQTGQDDEWQSNLKRIGGSIPQMMKIVEEQTGVKLSDSLIKMEPRGRKNN